MIKNNKGKAVLSSLMILLPMLAGSIMWNKLPLNFVTPWAGEAETGFFAGKTFFIFVLPVILLIFQWAVLIITDREFKKKQQNSKIITIVFWILPVISVIAEGIIFSAVLEKEISIGIIMPLLLGLMFIIIGNYLPKVLPNSVIGIKVSWALRNEDNWKKTHRFAGRLWVLGGFVLLFAIFFPPAAAITISVIIIIIMSALPVLYSYLYYKKQLKKGEYKEDIVRKKMGKGGIIASAVTVVIVAAVVLVLLFTGSIEARFDEDSLYIDSTFLSDSIIKYDDIDSVELRTDFDFGTRTNGFGSVKLSCGRFKNSEFGSYVLYAYNKCPSAVVIVSGDEHLVINAPTPEKTEEIYLSLIEKTE